VKGSLLFRSPIGVALLRGAFSEESTLRACTVRQLAEGRSISAGSLCPIRSIRVIGGSPFHVFNAVSNFPRKLVPDLVQYTCERPQ